MRATAQMGRVCTKLVISAQTISNDESKNYRLTLLDRKIGLRFLFDSEDNLFILIHKIAKAL